MPLNIIKSAPFLTLLEVVALFSFFKTDTGKVSEQRFSLFALISMNSASKTERGEKFEFGEKKSEKIAEKTNQRTKELSEVQFKLVLLQ